MEDFLALMPFKACPAGQSALMLFMTLGAEVTMVACNTSHDYHADIKLILTRARSFMKNLKFLCVHCGRPPATCKLKSEGLWQVLSNYGLRSASPFVIRTAVSMLDQ